MNLNIMKTESKKRITIVIITSALLYLTSPFFICYFSFFWLLRYFLTLWKNVWYPQLGPLLGGLDSAMLTKSPYSTDQQLNVGYYVTVQGKIELEEFRAVVRNGLKKFSQNNESSKRLSQVLITWAGYFVGEDEKNFKLKDHVRLLNLKELNGRMQRQCGLKAREIMSQKKIHQEHLTDDDVAQLNWTFLKVPYEVNTSPWEILLLHNPQPKSEQEAAKSRPWSTRVQENNSDCTTVIIVRFHHCLADGIALTSLFSHFFDQSQEYSYGRTLEFFDISKDKRRSYLESITQNFAHFILGLPEFVSHVVSCRAVDWPPTFLPSNNHDISFSSGHTIVVQFPKAKIRRIQKLFENHKIKSTTILHAVLALSITEYFKAYKTKYRESLANLPAHIFAVNPIGDKIKKNELTNNLTMLGVRIPLRPGLNDKDPKRILLDIQESYSYETDSRIRHVCKMLVNLIGLLPANMKPPLSALCKGLCISHIPSFENPVTILGKSVTSARVAACEFPTLSCITLFSFAIRDEIQGTFIVAKKVMESYDEAKALVDCFVQKLDDLHHDLIDMYRPKT